MPSIQSPISHEGNIGSYAEEELHAQSSPAAEEANESHAPGTNEAAGDAELAGVVHDLGGASSTLSPAAAEKENASSAEPSVAAASHQQAETPATGKPKNFYAAVRAQKKPHIEARKKQSDAAKAKFKQESARAKTSGAEKPASTETAQSSGSQDGLNMPPAKTPMVTGYRVEPEASNDKFSHVYASTDRGSGHVYTPPANFTGYTGKGKKTPKKSADAAQYNEAFIQGRLPTSRPLGTPGWIGFGGPERALEFANQKNSNPTEQDKGLNFVVKSFEMPSSTLDTIQKHAVHEGLGKELPHLPANVDRKAPNQFKLPTPYVDLINHTMTPGSVRQVDPAELEHQVEKSKTPGE